MVQVGDVIVSFDVLTEPFCCDLEACHGVCCVEGDAGAPLLLDEVEKLEAALPDIREELTPEAREVLDRDGVCYRDPSGDLVTSIVGGKDCVFCRRGTLTAADGRPFPCTLCAIEGAWRRQQERAHPGELRCDEGFMKPISCHLYPVRVGYYGAYYALNYHRWEVCAKAVEKGRELGIPVYRFLREPLVRKFGQEWYDELCLVAEELKKQHLI